MENETNDNLNNGGLTIFRMKRDWEGAKRSHFEFTPVINFSKSKN